MCSLTVTRRLFRIFGNCGQILCILCITEKSSHPMTGQRLFLLPPESAYDWISNLGKIRASSGPLAYLTILGLRLKSLYAEIQSHRKMVSSMSNQLWPVQEVLISQQLRLPLTMNVHDLRKSSTPIPVTLRTNPARLPKIWKTV